MCASLWEQYPSKHSYHSHALLVHRHTRLWWSLPQWKRLSPSPAYAVRFTVQLPSTVPPSPWEHFCATRLLSTALSPHCFFTTRLFTLSVAPLHLDLLSFPFRNLFMDSQKLVYSFFSLWSIPKRAVHASCWMQILYKLNTFLIVRLSPISSYLGLLQKKMGRWMEANMAQRNGMISHGCTLSQWPTWEHTTKITDLPDLKAIALRVINFYKQPVYFCWTETSLLVQDVNRKLEKKKIITFSSVGP